MKHTAYYLNLDTDGYLLSISTIGDGPHLDSIEGIDLSGDKINAYRWDGTNLVLDGGRMADIEQAEAVRAKAEQIAELTAQLRASDSIVLEALEGLMSATTATGFIAALISAARNIRATLTERADIRARLADLRGRNT